MTFLYTAFKKSISRFCMLVLILLVILTISKIDNSISVGVFKLG